MTDRPLATPVRQLLDAQGRVIATSKPARPPEKMSAVKFIRKLAEEAGGIQTAHGQALHRLAGHFISLQEELERVAALKDLTGEHSPERIEASAQGIYNVAKEATERGSNGRIVPDPWPVVSAREDQSEANVYRTMAVAALGGPCFFPVGTPEERGQPT